MIAKVVEYFEVLAVSYRSMFECFSSQKNVPPSNAKGIFDKNGAY